VRDGCPNLLAVGVLEVALVPARAFNVDRARIRYHSIHVHQHGKSSLCCCQQLLSLTVRPIVDGSPQPVDVVLIHHLRKGQDLANKQRHAHFINGGVGVR